MAIRVDFVSPEETLYTGSATQVIARTRGGGEIAFLTGHEPFIGSLVPSQVRVMEDSGEVMRFAVRGGFVLVSGTMSETRVTVLSDAAQPASEIDRAAAEADRAEAEQALAANADDPYARDDLNWAEVRLATISEAGAAH